MPLRRKNSIGFAQQPVRIGGELQRMMQYHSIHTVIGKRQRAGLAHQADFSP